MAESSADAMERNARLYPWYAALFNAFFWMPVFFLYFGKHLPLSQVLQLEAIYYVCVVVLEVPSGYVSDRFGRKRTLVASAIAMVAAYVTFLVGSSFAVFGLAQVLLASGIALNSGTDTSFHYDSLAEVEREAEYAEREAAVARSALLATALAGLVGGAIALLDLRLAYGLSALVAVANLVVVALFREPKHSFKNKAAHFHNQVANCLKHLKRPQLAWLFGFAVLAVVVNHVPYEFYQPYLELLGASFGLDQHTSLATGVHMAAATLLGAWVAGHSARIADKIGTHKTLLLAACIQLAIVLSMAAFLHIVVVAIILLRGVPGGLYKAPLKAAVTPRIPRRERATYLSIQSLAGRLAFAALLAGLSLAAGTAEPDNWPVLSHMLTLSAVVVGAGLIALG
ncbi:MAG: MFS transporter, partial [Persicimonas sp.]